MTRNLGRVSAVLVATLMTLMLTVWSAAAATRGPQQPTLTDLSVTHGILHGILTVPGAETASAVESGTLRVQFGDGTSHRAKVTPIAQEQRTALILIDTSGSMAGGKLTAAKAAAKSFMSQLPGDVRVGLADFSTSPHVLVAPTTQHQPILAALGKLKAHGETSLYDAIQLGVGALGTNGSRTIVLLSDGGDTVSNSSLSSTESALHSSGVHMSAIGFRTNESQYGVLGKLADAGHGTMVRATDSASLNTAFASAARRIAAQMRLAVAVPVGVGGVQNITVTGTVTGKSFSATTKASLPAAGTFSSAAGPATHIAPSTSSLSGRAVWIASGAVFVGVLTVILLVASSAFTPQARKRIKSLDTYVGTAVGSAKDTSSRRTVDLTGGLLRVGDAVAKHRDSSANTALLLERADLPLRLNEWYVLRGLAAFVGACLGWMFIHGSVVAGFVGVLLGLAAGVILPALILKTRARRRAQKFESQLPDNLTLVASSLSSGFGLPQAIDALARDAAEPSAKEFARALAETRIGADLEDALDRLATRMDSQSLTWTVMAIRIQRHVGGNLADTLRTTAATLRERESLRRQVRALSADGRISSYILIALPIVMAGWMSVVNRPYVSLLWTKPLGLVMLGIGIIAMIIGTFWMRQTIKVEV